MSTNINVKDYFQEMENLYDPNLVTSFEVTDKFSTKAKTAQAAWLMLQSEDWKNRIADGCSARVIDMFFISSDLNFPNGVLLKANMAIQGSLKINFNFDPVTKETLRNMIKKRLALSILEDFPFIQKKREVLLAAGEPVSISLRLFGAGKFWTHVDLSNLRRGPLRKNLDKVLSSEGAEFIDISSTMVGGNLLPIPLGPNKILMLKIRFKEKVTEDNVEEFTRSLRPFFHDCGLGEMGVSLENI